MKSILNSMFPASLFGSGGNEPVHLVNSKKRHSAKGILY